MKNYEERGPYAPEAIGPSSSVGWIEVLLIITILGGGMWGILYIAKDTGKLTEEQKQEQQAFYHYESKFMTKDLVQCKVFYYATDTTQEHEIAWAIRDHFRSHTAEELALGDIPENVMTMQFEERWLEYYLNTLKSQNHETDIIITTDSY